MAREAIAVMLVLESTSHLRDPRLVSTWLLGKRDSVRMTQGGSVRSKERPRVLGFFFPGLEMRDCISVSNKIR